MTLELETELGRFRAVVLDGQRTILFECPVCKDWGHLDDDQANGRISVDHSGDTASPYNQGRPCTYHETHNFLASIRSAVVSRALTGFDPWVDPDEARIEETP